MGSVCWPWYWLSRHGPQPTWPSRWPGTSPRRDWLGLVEHAGFDAQPEAWKGTALYRMLNETSLGAMLEDILSQVADQGFRKETGHR